MLSIYNPIFNLVWLIANSDVPRDFRLVGHSSSHNLANLKDQEPQTLRAAFIITVGNLGYSVAFGRHIGPEEGFQLAVAGVGNRSREPKT